MIRCYKYLICRETAIPTLFPSLSLRKICDGIVGRFASTSSWWFACIIGSIETGIVCPQAINTNPKSKITSFFIARIIHKPPLCEYRILVPSHCSAIYRDNHRTKWELSGPRVGEVWTVRRAPWSVLVQPNIKISPPARGIDIFMVRAIGHSSLRSPKANLLERSNNRSAHFSRRTLVGSRPA